MDYDTLRRQDPLARPQPAACLEDGGAGVGLDDQDTLGNAFLLSQLPEDEEQPPEAEEAVEAADVGAQAPVYDLAQLRADPERMQALRDDPATARIARLLDEADESYGSLLTAEGGRTPGRVVVTTSEGNGGQPVLVIVPPGFSADQETAVHTHYHGNDTNVAGEHHATGRTQAILGAVAANPQTILVMPEDAAMDWTDRGDDVLYSARWDNATDQPATTADALRAVGQDPDAVDHRIVSAHSGGGRALNGLVHSGGIEADELLMHDCMYGNWGSSVRHWLVDLPADQRPHVSYYRAENDPARSARYERALGDGYDQLDMGEHEHNLTLSQHFGQSLPLPTPAEEERDSAQERR